MFSVRSKMTPLAPPYPPPPPPLRALFSTPPRVQLRWPAPARGGPTPKRNRSRAVVQSCVQTWWQLCEKYPPPREGTPQNHPPPPCGYPPGGPGNTPPFWGVKNTPKTPKTPRTTGFLGTRTPLFWGFWPFLGPPFLDPQPRGVSILTPHDRGGWRSVGWF